MNVWLGMASQGIKAEHLTHPLQHEQRTCTVCVCCSLRPQVVFMMHSNSPPLGIAFTKGAWLAAPHMHTCLCATSLSVCGTPQCTLAQHACVTSPTSLCMLRQHLPPTLPMLFCPDRLGRQCICPLPAHTCPICKPLDHV